MSTSKELAPSQRSHVAGGNVFVERLDEPTPGQYWRAKDDIEGRYDDRGEYDDTPKGTVLMLREIVQADGQAHVIVLASHPLWGEDPSGQQYHADDFEKLWERALDGEMVRARELSKLVNEMRLTQEAMSRPAPESPVAARLGHQPSLNEGGATGKELATDSGLAAMTEHVSYVQSRADKQLARIQKFSEKLSDQASAMARYHQEKATAMIAAAQSQLQSLQSVMGKVKNLKFYTGEGVVVTQLVEGAPAAKDAPITIFQDLLAFDEELLLRLDQDGLDHRMVADVAQALRDPALLNQMIPAERGLVLVRYRGSYKEFVAHKDTDDSTRSAMVSQYNEEMSDESMRHRLMYRDGSAVYLIECDGVLPNIEQLLPSAAEQMSYFQKDRWDSKKGRHVKDSITTDDIAYARAQRKQMAKLTDFARVLIVLWGLHDREDFFGTTNIPTFSNWLEEGFQQTFLRLVSHDMLIGEVRPSYGDYRTESNRFLAAGVMVAIDAVHAITERTAPGCYFHSDRSGESRQTWFPIQRYQLCRVSYAKGKPFVSIEVKSDGDKKVTPVELKIGSYNYLVIDRALPEDIRYYLHSRKERKNYADYVVMFKLALEYVSQRSARELPWSEWIEEQLVAAGLVADTEVRRRAVLNGLSTIRSGTKDGLLPATPDDATKAVREAALNAVHAEIGNSDRQIAAVEQWCENNGYTPIALCFTDRNTWVLYRVAITSETDPRFNPFPWVVRQPISFLSSGDVQDQPGSRFEHYALHPGERCLKEWSAAPLWFETRCPGGLTHKRALSNLDGVADRSKVLGDTAALVPALMKATKEYAAKWRTQVHRMRAQFPIGTVIHRRQPHILVINVDAAHACATWGSEDQRNEVIAWINSTYERPERALSALEEPCELSLAAVPLDHAGKGAKALWMDAPRDWIGDEQRWIKAVTRPKNAAKDWVPEYRLTTLTPVGARLLPFLIEYCERPTK